MGKADDLSFGFLTGLEALSENNTCLPHFKENEELSIAIY